LAKNLKLNIKNTQLAAALKLNQLKKAPPPAVEPPPPAVKREEAPPPPPPPPKEAPPVAAAPKTPPARKEAPAASVPPKPAASAAPLARKPEPAAPLKPPEARAPATPPAQPSASAETAEALKRRPPGFKEYRDLKPQRKTDDKRAFDARDRHGLRDTDDQGWRKRRPVQKVRFLHEEEVVRPKSLSVRVPITVKDLAAEMKLKASQLISKLFMQGVVVTLNDYLDDETTIQLLGHEFDCAITIDTSEESRLRITDQTIKEEIRATPAADLTIRPPVVAFMGHVDHGKTSLIDAIRKTNLAAAEAGAITQHIGAFKCQTAVGDLAILDTPGHEAFSAMRERGADVTDIVVLVIAGDEGMRTQTIEAMNQAKEASVPIVVAINKCDKPNFNAETVYRQLADHNLLPEAWGGETITVNCSALSGQGIKELLEMLALQAEILELKAAPASRARGTVIESQMHKGLGAVATLLVQNGTLRMGDALVFGQHFARVKTMHDENGRELASAGPSTPVKITGLSGLPEAGSEFIVVKNEKEAKELSAGRTAGAKALSLQQAKKAGVESLLQQKASAAEKKVLNLILRADVQGSLEALRTSLFKIPSTRVDINVIASGVGEISESDIQLAAASKATIIGFHTRIESHAEPLIKQTKVAVKLHDIIYHAIDDVKELMLALLDKIAQETDTGTALVKATFKASQLGVIAGCQVTDGVIKRGGQVRVLRNNELVWKGPIASLKRQKEDVREVAKGYECGILLQNYNDVKEGDVLQAFEITYLEQQLT
jgi:translation initiation factor IF-2